MQVDQIYHGDCIEILNTLPEQPVDLIFADPPYNLQLQNDGLQMRSDWELPICTGVERIKVDGTKAHATQKPEALLYRVVLAASNSGDLVLDAFFGTGTTGAVAKKLHHRWIGIERVVLSRPRHRRSPSRILALEPFAALEACPERSRRGKLREGSNCLNEKLFVEKPLGMFENLGFLLYNRGRFAGLRPSKISFFFWLFQSPAGDWKSQKKEFCAGGKPPPRPH